MSLDKLKQEIIRKIEDTDDLVLLYTINQMLNKYSTHGSVYEINENAIIYGDGDSNDDAVDYKISGTSIGNIEFEKQVLSIIEDCGKGITAAHKEVKSTMDKWVQDRLNGIL